jgi:hypothetical protein
VKLKVVIHRGGKETLDYGMRISLRAYVVQGTHYGRNLLRSRCTDVAKAKQAVVAKLPAGTEIEWEVRE